MKKIIAIIMTVLLILGLTSCGKTDISSDGQSAANDFVKPQNYVTVLHIKINPEFNMYLDSSGCVLAIEPLNDDAKTFSDDIELGDKNFETVIDSIITIANQKNFVKADATIEFSITENKDDAVKTDEILTKSKAKATAVAADLKIDVVINTASGVKGEVVNDKAPEPKDENEQSDKIEQIEDKINQTDKEISDKEAEKQEKHKHIFASATCASPAKCVECGITVGKALEHRFNNGMCTICGAHDETYVPSYTSALQKKGYWSFRFADNGTLYDGSLIINKSLEGFGIAVGFGDPFSKLPPEFQEEVRTQLTDSYVLFNGVEYYIGRGDGDAIETVTEDKNTVTVADCDGNKIVLTRVGEDTLQVSKSSNSFVLIGKLPVGTKLEFKTDI